VASALGPLRHDLSLRLLSADTLGTAQAVAQQLGVALEIVADGEQKRALVDQLGARRCAGVGDGRSDVAMLRAAALGIAVIGPEGASAQAVAAADVVCNSVFDALALLNKPARLTATLRP
jgi:P-type E1-E2 ATPase